MGGQEAWGLRAAAFALAGIAGAALQIQQAALWSPVAYPALLALATCMLMLARVGSRARAPALLLTLACALFAVTGLRAGLRLADALPDALEGEDIVVTGVVAELPRQLKDGVRFTVSSGDDKLATTADGFAVFSDLAPTTGGGSHVAASD